MKNKGITVWEYVEGRIQALRLEGRKVTAGNYHKAASCLKRFRDDDSLSFSEWTPDFIGEFNAYLTNTGIQKATISFYNRVLRSIYNQAVSDGLVKNEHPFDSVYTKVDARQTPVKVENQDGVLINLDAYSKDEIISKYRTLQRRYNTLVGKIADLVRV